MMNKRTTDTSPDLSATPDENREAFLRDIVDMFRRKRAGHTNKWVYHNGYRGAHQPLGSELWSEFTAAHDDYYIRPEEIDLIKDSLKNNRLQRLFAGADAMIDFGSGDAYAVRHKAMPIVHGVDSIKIYAPVDLSAGLLQQAKNEAVANENKRVPPITVKPINGDFYTGKAANGRKIKLPGDVRAAFLLGSTITNMEMDVGGRFPRDNIIKDIRQLAHFVGESGKGHTLTFGWDANPSLDDALTAYDHKKWKQLVVGLMLDVQHTLRPQGNFNPLAWEHEAVVDDKNHVIHQCVKATEDQDFCIGDECFSIKAGEEFVVNNNFKYPRDLFESMIEEAGYTAYAPIMHDSGRMTLQTMSI